MAFVGPDKSIEIKCWSDRVDGGEIKTVVAIKGLLGAKFGCGHRSAAPGR